MPEGRIDYKSAVPVGRRFTPAKADVGVCRCLVRPVRHAHLAVVVALLRQSVGGCGLLREGHVKGIVLRSRCSNSIFTVEVGTGQQCYVHFVHVKANLSRVSSNIQPGMECSRRAHVNIPSAPILSCYEVQHALLSRKFIRRLVIVFHAHNILRPQAVGLHGIGLAVVNIYCWSGVVGILYCSANPVNRQLGYHHVGQQTYARVGSVHLPLRWHVGGVVAFLYGCAPLYGDAAKLHLPVYAVTCRRGGLRAVGQGGLRRCAGTTTCQRH